MTNQESAQHPHIRFPRGFVNWLALTVGVLLLTIAVSNLIAQLFFGHRLAFRQFERQDVVLDVLALGFLLALFTIQHVRNNFRLLWSAILGARLVAWVGKFALYLPENFVPAWQLFYSLANIAVITLFCFALLRGERIDRFLVEAPLALVAKLMKLEVKEQVDKA